MKQEADEAVILIREATEKKKEEEEAKQGLVIIKALYGKLEEMNFENSTFVIDVTIPVQFLVNSSQLHLNATSKVRYFVLVK
jgi:DnaJ family protein C protein 11